MTGKFDLPSAGASYAKHESSPTLAESSQLREYLAYLRINPKLKLMYRHVNDQGIKTVILHHESSKSTLSLSSSIRE